MTEDERFAGVAAARPEIATFNLGTMNYEGYPTPARWPSTPCAQPRLAALTLRRAATAIFFPWRRKLGAMRV